MSIRANLCGTWQIQCKISSCKSMFLIIRDNHPPSLSLICMWWDEKNYTHLHWQHLIRRFMIWLQGEVYHSRQMTFPHWPLSTQKMQTGIMKMETVQQKMIKCYDSNGQFLLSSLLELFQMPFFVHPERQTNVCHNFEFLQILMLPTHIPTPLFHQGVLLY